MEHDCYPFELQPLCYDYAALEPHIDARTMEIHHNRHLKKYVDSLNKALENCPTYHDWSLEKLIRQGHCLPYSIQTEVSNNAGGVFNHNFFFSGMSPNNSGQKGNWPMGQLAQALTMQFGSPAQFLKKFKDTALKVFGSGYAVLCADKQNRLKLIITPNQCTVIQLDLMPILMIDVWEHAYYLKYQNLRADYIDNWFAVINWKRAELCFREGMSST